MANEPRQPTGTWLTGKNVRTADPEKGLKNVTPGVSAAVVAGEEEPNQSANKPEWYAYRRGQGYTEQQLASLSKAELLDLPDDPDDYEEPEPEESQGPQDPQSDGNDEG